MPPQDWSQYPEEFAKRFTTISRESFYSVIGKKEAPLDVNLASVFAIQMLLADLAPATAAPQSAREMPVDYSREPWKLADSPTVRAVDVDDASQVCQPKTGLIVATEVERQAVLKKMRPPKGKRSILQIYSGKNTCFVGRLGVTDVVLTMTAMGSIGRDASTIVVAEIIRSWKLSAVIMVGIAFGKDSRKQRIGGVLISDKILSFEPERVGQYANENRGAQPAAGALLLNRFRNVIGWNFKSPDGKQCDFQVGPILSGEKLVDNVDFKQSLFQRFPNAIGGEMEGVGIAAAADRNGCEWIVVKAICDWGDGTKTKNHQEFAAASAVSLVEHVLNQPGALDTIGQ